MNIDKNLRGSRARGLFHFFCVALLSIHAVAALDAQRTWVVDQAGAGDFADLPPALAAANDGDTILVRSGRYGNAVTGKGVRILGLGGVSVGQLGVSGVRAGATLVAANLKASFLDIRKNDGGVHLDRIEVFNPFFGVQVRASKLVSLRRSTIASAQATFADSNISLVETSMTALTNRTGLRADRCRLDLANVTIQGSAADCRFGSFPPTPGLTLSSSTTRITGGGSTMRAGRDSNLCPFRTQAPAIQSYGTSVVRIDPMVTLVSTNGAPHVRGATPIIEPIGATFAHAGIPGSSVATDVAAPPGTGVILFVSSPTPPIQLPFGTIWLDPVASVVLDQAVVGPTGHRLRSFALGTFFPRGLALAFQAGVVTGGTLSVSTPDIAILH